jgi:glycosyltransferase involved in cell wall biosynthesis
MGRVGAVMKPAAAIRNAAKCSAADDRIAPPAEPAVESSAQDVRALFVLSTLSFGGSETKVVRVANELQKRGVLTGIVYLNAPDDLRSAIAPAIPVWHLHRWGKFSIAAARSLRRLVKDQHPRTVFSVNLYPALYVSLALAGLGRRPRAVALINTTDMPAGSAWRTSFYRPFLRRFDATVYGCELQRSRWLSELHYPAERSMVLYNGVDNVHFTPAADGTQSLAARLRWGIDPQSFVVGTVGMLRPEKNQSVLIDAVAELRRQSIPAHLLLVGEGALREELERRAAQLRVQDYVTFAGKQRDVRQALAAMDVFVLPSTHVETFSNAALEAMSMATPVVLSRIGGAEEMIREGEQGYTLTPAELPDRLVPVLAELHSNRDLRRRMGESARLRVAREFSLERMVEGYAGLIEASAARMSGEAVRDK